jgi:membrane protease YdiL (CAAX protease family)
VRLSLRRAEFGVLAAASVASATQRVVPSRARLATNLVAAGAALGAARSAGVTWNALGFGDGAGRGLRHGGLAGAAAGAVVGSLAAVPATRGWFAQGRTQELRRRDAAFEVFVRIPFETALAEELIFRGALLGIALQRRKPVRAVLTSSLAFGVWHVLPTLDSLGGSSIGEQVADSHARQGGAVLAAVAATSAAGVGFAWLRLRSGSILAPVIAHAALNAASFATSFFAGTAR